VTKCLQQLQENNPSLLLTGAGLRKLERDARYVPAIAEAITSVLLNSFRPDSARIAKILAWQDPVENQPTKAQSQSQMPVSEVTPELLCRSLEKRIRFGLAQPERTKSSEAESVSGKPIIESCPLSPVDNDWSDWSILHDNLDEHSITKAKSGVSSGAEELNQPTPTNNNPRKLLYTPSDDDCDGYEDW
jgi:hypothetical protein